MNSELIPNLLFIDITSLAFSNHSGLTSTVKPVLLNPPLVPISSSKLWNKFTASFARRAITGTE